MVTKEEFMAYYRVQMEGYYNMLDSRAVKATCLSLKKYMEIIKNYDLYYNKYIKEA
jgi:hypothetical protein